MALLLLAASVVLKLTSAAAYDDPATSDSTFVDSCDSLRLARLYTFCAVPYYIDFYKRDVPQNKSCSRAQQFKKCTEEADTATQCTGQQYSLKSTVQYFTAVILGSNARVCNISADTEDKLLSLPEIRVVHRGRNKETALHRKLGLGFDKTSRREELLSKQDTVNVQGVRPPRHMRLDAAPDSTATSVSQLNNADESEPANLVKETAIANTAQRMETSQPVTSYARGAIVNGAETGMGGSVRTANATGIIEASTANATSSTTLEASTSKATTLSPVPTNEQNTGARVGGARTGPSNNAENQAPKLSSVIPNASDTLSSTPESSAADAKSSSAPVADENIKVAGKNALGAGAAWRKIGQATTCLPLNPTFDYNDKCQEERFTYLRRFFTCGISFQHNMALPDQNCLCFYNYQKCLEEARQELVCNPDQDPLLMSATILSNLMITMYAFNCAPHASYVFEADPGTGHGALSTSTCCNQKLGLQKAIMCYASYFYLSEMKTPTLWQSTHGSCSLVTDLQRCINFAEQRTKCTDCRVGRHVNRFLGVIVQPHHQECLTATGSKKSLGPYMKPNCKPARVFKRALTCAIQFQDLVEMELKKERKQSVLCGHASRLHTCLEDSVEGTGCMGDTHMSSQLKMYKKLLEDVYGIQCNTLSQREVSLGRRSPLNRKLPFGTMNRVVHPLGNYGDEDYDDTKEAPNIQGHFAGPRRSLSQDDSEDDADYERLMSDVSYFQRRKLRLGGLALNGRQTDDLQRLPLQMIGVNPKVRSRNVVDDKMRIPPVSHGGNIRESLVGNQKRMLAAQPLQAVMRHVNFGKVAEAKKRDFEEEYFFGDDYSEHGHIPLLPEEMKLFLQMKAVAPKVLNVLESNKTLAGAPNLDTMNCSKEKVQPALRTCEESLLTVMTRWPKEMNDSVALLNLTKGKDVICGDIAKYKECLLHALKSHDCDHPELVQDIMTQKGNALHLPLCSASPRLKLEITLVTFMAVLAFLLV
ncbi:uncharacterized protein LOC135378163 [Ornithodoros turicata]|uniref:uncharacterized protein LOC135378163 n=1 Tax=Ornithodoros turicata TaxID=34597 RepID=UPI003138A85D